MREREGRGGDKELPSALLLARGGKEGRGRQLHHQPLLCQGVCFYHSILATAPPASCGFKILEVLQELSISFLEIGTHSLFN